MHSRGNGARIAKLTVDDVNAAVLIEHRHTGRGRIIKRERRRDVVQRLEITRIGEDVKTIVVEMRRRLDAVQRMVNAIAIVVATWGRDVVQRKRGIEDRPHLLD